MHIRGQSDDFGHALLCAVGLAGSECSPENAIDVICLPDVANEMACMQDSMTTLAALTIRAGPDEYWKVVCINRGSDLPSIAGAPQSDLSTALRAPQLEPRTRRGTGGGD
jgi:hypothetical protein